MIDAFGEYVVGVQPAEVIPGNSLFGGDGGAAGLVGAGSPEGAVAADPGHTYLDVSDGAFYAKKTGAGSVGWIQLIA